VLNVVKLPQKPTPIMSFVLGLNPLNSNIRRFASGIILVEESAVTTGLAVIPPSKKEPPTLIAEVCHPWNFPNLLGSLAIHSAASRPHWKREKAPKKAPIPSASASCGIIKPVMMVLMILIRVGKDAYLSREWMTVCEF
jgi:hypothetical protein